MSEHEKIIVKLNNFLSKTLITDVGSTRNNVAKLIKKIVENLNWIMAKSRFRSKGPKFGNKICLKISCVF